MQLRSAKALGIPGRLSAAARAARRAETGLGILGHHDGQTIKAATGAGRMMAATTELPTVEVLYLDGCPSHERLMPTVRRLAEGVDATVAVRRVETTEEAEAARFLGSPSVRVNGVDIEPGADARTDFGLKCRLYRTPDGLSGEPVESWLLNALGGQVAPSEAKAQRSAPDDVDVTLGSPDR